MCLFFLLFFVFEIWFKIDVRKIGDNSCYLCYGGGYFGVIGSVSKKLYFFVLIINKYDGCYGW